ncbi:hypothetical protein [Ilumatobacter nonamiensis]|uniref:hypothetical protein n=1 Tax=Ilumatobacter nonamiensis TaxID=467093 RepID=UPI00034B503F|nr:hypothetical protein [Ilumatobacter nonamiensis]
MSKRSIKRKLTKTTSRLTALRSELSVIDEQMRSLDDDAQEAATRAVVADNTAATREAREASEHLAAHRRQRERVEAEIGELSRRQDELLDQLIESDRRV